MRCRHVIAAVGVAAGLALAGCGPSGSDAGSVAGQAGIGVAGPGVSPSPGTVSGGVTQTAQAVPTPGTHPPSVTLTRGNFSPHPVPSISNPNGLVVTVSVDPEDPGPTICPGTYHLTGHVTVNKGPANVSYIWSYSPAGLSLGTPPTPVTLHFGGTGQQTKTVTGDWSTDPSARWGTTNQAYLVITDPAPQQLLQPISAGTSWLDYCGGTAAKPTVVSVAGCTGSTPSGTFKTTVSVAGGPQTVHFTWHFSDGQTSQGQLAFTLANTSASQDATISHPLAPASGPVVRPPSITVWITVESPAAMTTAKTTASCPVVAEQ